ncbi:MAG: hypothetical protein RLZZ272_1740 [Actinomycetota bacterium]
MSLDAPRPIHRDRSVLLLAAAAVVVLVTVGLVLTFGVNRPPELGGLVAGSDAPPEGIARISWREDEACLEVLRVGEEPREVTCQFEGGELLGWRDGTIAMRTWSSVGEELVFVEEATGAVTRRLVPPEESKDLPTSPYGAVRALTSGGTMTVTDAASGAVVWRVEVPSNYRIDVSARTGDGAWIAMVDSASRLLLVAADGSAPPRVWVEDLGNSYDPLLWEGTGTVPE